MLQAWADQIEHFGGSWNNCWANHLVSPSSKQFELPYLTEPWKRNCMCLPQILVIMVPSLWLSLAWMSSWMLLLIHHPRSEHLLEIIGFRWPSQNHITYYIIPDLSIYFSDFSCIIRMFPYGRRNHHIFPQKNVWSPAVLRSSPRSPRGGSPRDGSPRGSPRGDGDGEVLGEEAIQTSQRLCVYIYIYVFMCIHIAM